MTTRVEFHGTRIESGEVSMRPTIWADIPDYITWKRSEQTVVDFRFCYQRSVGLDRVLEERIQHLKEQITAGEEHRCEALEVFIRGEHAGWVDLHWNRADEPHYKEFSLFLIGRESEEVSIYRTILSCITELMINRNGLGRLGFAISDDNANMIEAGRMIGYRIEGIAKDACLLGGGKMHDIFRMGILADEWSKD